MEFSHHVLRLLFFLSFPAITTILGRRGQNGQCHGQMVVRILGWKRDNGTTTQGFFSPSFFVLTFTFSWSFLSTFSSSTFSLTFFFLLFTPFFQLLFLPPLTENCVSFFLYLVSITIFMERKKIFSSSRNECRKELSFFPACVG